MGIEEILKETLDARIEEALKVKIEEILKAKIEKNLETIPRRKSILVSASTRSIPRRESREDTASHNRRMLASIPPRTHSSRRDSPVLLRLLQEIEAAQEK